MDDTLQIYTLGGLTICRNGEPFAAITSRRAQALLVYLAFTAQAHSREYLGEMFWDERSNERALGNMRLLLSRSSLIAALIP